MVYDKLENIGHYRGISAWFDMAAKFLENTDLTALPLGRTEIHGDKVFINVMEAVAKDEHEVDYEIHREYMDIQIDLEGTEVILIGGGDIKEKKPFREDIDFGTVLCEEAARLYMGAGRFALCMGEEPHKPGIAVLPERKIKKCVVKAAVR